MTRGILEDASGEHLHLEGRKDVMTLSVPKTEALYSSLAGDPDLSGLVELYVDEMPDRIETLKETFESGDMELLRRTAHQLKGAAGSYGFDQLTPYAATLEASIRNDQPENEIRELLDVLVELCQKVRAGVPD